MASGLDGHTIAEVRDQFVGLQRLRLPAIVLSAILEPYLYISLVLLSRFTANTMKMYLNFFLSQINQLNKIQTLFFVWFRVFLVCGFEYGMVAWTGSIVSSMCQGSSLRRESHLVRLLLDLLPPYPSDRNESCSLLCSAFVVASSTKRPLGSCCGLDVLTRGSDIIHTTNFPFTETKDQYCYCDCEHSSRNVGEVAKLASQHIGKARPDAYVTLVRAKPNIHLARQAGPDASVATSLSSYHQPPLPHEIDSQAIVRLACASELRINTRCMAEALALNSESMKLIFALDREQHKTASNTIDH